MPRSRALPRRRFLELLAAGSAAIAAASTPAGAARARRTTPAGAAPARSKALAAELANQKRYVAAALETLRKYPLPAGSEPAFVFTPLEAAKAPRARDRKRS